MWKCKILAFCSVVDYRFQRLRMLNNAKNSYVRRWDTRMSIVDGFGNSYLQYISVALDKKVQITSFCFSVVGN